MIEANLPELPVWWLALYIWIFMAIAEKAWAFAAEAWPILVVVALLAVTSWALCRE